MRWLVDVTPLIFRSITTTLNANVQVFISDPISEGGTTSLFIKKWWKSNSPQEIVVHSFSRCYSRFKMEKDYLLFLRIDSDGFYHTDNCSGNKELKNPNEFNDALSALKDKSVNNSD